VRTTCNHAKFRDMKIFETVIGILTSPFIWIYDRLVKRRPSSPPEFWLFVGELRNRGVSGQLQMQASPIDGVSRSAVVILDPNPSTYSVVNLFKCNSVATADLLLADLESNEGMSHTRQRSCYLMSVTFLVPNDQLAAIVAEAFDVFELPPSLV